MEKFTPLKKQSKRAQREHHALQRGSWNGVCPATRIMPNGKAYDRSKKKQELRKAVD